MNWQERDLVIVGAGPAGIAAALACAGQSKPLRVTIVDAGRHFRKRRCPVDHRSTCHGCDSLCNVISGFGGSIHFGDAVKLSYFPSGIRLKTHFGDGLATEYMDRAIGLLFPGVRERFALCATTHLRDLAVKDYPVAIMESRDVKDATEDWWQKLKSTQGLDIALETEVSVIEPGADRIKVICNQKDGPQLRLRARKVLVAVGRKGLLWWKREIRRLGLLHDEPVVSFGLRLECPNRFLAKAAAWHPDFKVSMGNQNLKFKTFCFCGSTDRGAGGRIKFADYGDFTLLDGHVDPDSTSGVGNFSLLTQLRAADGSPRDFDWVWSNIIDPYRRLRVDRPGKPVFQWYPDFKAKTLSCTSLETFIAQAGFHPTATDYQLSNIAGLLTDHQHEGFQSSLEELFRIFTCGDPSGLEQIQNQSGIAGICLENLWDVVSLDSDMKSSVENLYVAGDCAGIAQGILQAAAAGLAACEGICRTL